MIPWLNFNPSQKIYFMNQHTRIEQNKSDAVEVIKEMLTNA